MTFSFAAGIVYPLPAGIPESALLSLAVLAVLITASFILYFTNAGRLRVVNLPGVLDDFNAAGFSYDPAQNIFFSRQDAWQKEFGYTSLYDHLAVDMSMVFHAEPIPFSYGGKDWLVELWKGQYGMTTGGEIGVYIGEDNVLFPKWGGYRHYRAAEGAERLPLKFTLRKGKRQLFTRNEKHWWLTGFVLGEYIEPYELTMEAQITLLDSRMRDAFLEAAKRLGYPADAFDIDLNTVSFVFSLPYSPQPISQQGGKARRVQAQNKWRCKEFKLLMESETDAETRLERYRMKSGSRYKRLLNVDGSQARMKLYKKGKHYAYGEGPDA